MQQHGFAKAHRLTRAAHTAKALATSCTPDRASNLGDTVIVPMHITTRAPSWQDRR
jgi:hypothetical protein